MIKVREHQLDDVLSRLAEFAHSQNPHDGVAYRYLLCGSYLVPPYRMLADRRSFKRFLKGGRWRDCCVKLPLRADTIRIKNNLRVFGYGPKRDQTAKIALAGLSRDGRLSREIRARHLLSQVIKPSFGVAPVVSYDQLGARWLVEKQISGKLKDDSVTEEFVVDHALSFYRSTARMREIGQRPVEGLSVVSVAAFLPQASQQHFSEKLASLRWPMVLGHGDLSKGNMIRDARGALYLVDWEKAGMMPLASDLRTLYARQPELRDAILALIGALGERATNTASPEIQMALAFAAKAGMLERNREYATQYFVHVDRMEIEQADRHVHNLIAGNQELAATLISAA